MPKYVSHNRARTTWRLLLVIMVPILLGLGIFGLVKLVKSSNTAFGVQELGMAPAETYAYNGSGILYIHGGKLVYEDFSDAKKNYANSVSTESVQIAASQNISALYNENAVQIIGSSTPVELTGSVVSVRCGLNHLAVLQRDSAGNLSLAAYSATGALADVVDLAGATLVDFGFASQQSDAMWTITLDSSGSVPVSTLTTYDLAKAATTGVLTMQGHLVEKLYFTGSSVFAVDTSNLIRFDSAGNSEAYRLLVYGWKFADACTSGGSVSFLFRSRNTQSSTVRLYTVEEGGSAQEKLASVSLPSDVHSAFLASGKLVACASDKVYVYSQSGTLSQTLPLEFAITGAAKLSDSSALLFGEGAAYLINFK